MGALPGYLGSLTLLRSSFHYEEQSVIMWSLTISQLRGAAQRGDATARSEAEQELEKRAARNARQVAAAREERRRAEEGDADALARVEAKRTYTRDKKYKMRKRQTTLESLLGSRGQPSEEPTLETPSNDNIKSEPAVETPDPIPPPPQDIIEISDDEIDAKPNIHSLSRQHSQTPPGAPGPAHGLPSTPPRPRTPASLAREEGQASKEVLQKQLEKKKIEIDMLELQLQMRNRPEVQ